MSRVARHRCEHVELRANAQVGQHVPIEHVCHAPNLPNPPAYLSTDLAIHLPTYLLTCKHACRHTTAQRSTAQHSTGRLQRSKAQARHRHGHGHSVALRCVALRCVGMGTGTGTGTGMGMGTGTGTSTGTGTVAYHGIA